MSGICIILADTRKVIIILGWKSEGSGQLRRHTRRRLVTIEVITKKIKKKKTGNAIVEFRWL